MDTLNFQPTLRKSWLVQRLEKPRTATGPLADLASALSFGGGLVNGGLSKEGMNLIKTIFSFDYMGSSEFEWGIVPSCLEFLAKNAKDLVAGEVEPKNGKPIVYYICHKAHAKEVPDRITALALDPPAAKERVCLSDYFEKDVKYPTRAVGWLDCSNGFMFFVDQEMFEQTCQLFGINL